MSKPPANTEFNTLRAAIKVLMSPVLYHPFFALIHFQILIINVI